MIQRIQTILLFLAAALCVAFLFFPTWLVMNPDDGDGGSKTITASPLSVRVESSQMSIDNPFTEETLGLTSNTFLTIQFGLVLVIAGLLLVTIFMYNNRQLQIKMAYGGIVLLMAMFVMLVPIRTWLQDMGGDATASGELYRSLPQWGLAAPLIALLLTWWAIKRIQKDEKMVRGMDRIR
ncbi:MAG: DUF4293 domain-containing protein [Bacteroidia bacterium]